MYTFSERATNFFFMYEYTVYPCFKVGVLHQFKQPGSYPESILPSGQRSLLVAGSADFAHWPNGGLQSTTQDGYLYVLQMLGNKKRHVFI